MAKIGSIDSFSERVICSRLAFWERVEDDIVFLIMRMKMKMENWLNQGVENMRVVKYSMLILNCDKGKNDISINVEGKKTWCYIPGVDYRAGLYCCELLRCEPRAGRFW